MIGAQVDGEVESFERWSYDKVAEAVAYGKPAAYKPNCNLVVIDLLVRSGYIAVSRRLHECGHTRERLEPAWLTDDSLVHLAVSKGEANFMDHFYAPGESAALPGLPGLLFGNSDRDERRDEL